MGVKLHKFHPEWSASHNRICSHADRNRPWADQERHGVSSCGAFCTVSKLALFLSSLLSSLHPRVPQRALQWAEHWFDRCSVRIESGRGNLQCLAGTCERRQRLRTASHRTAPHRTARHGTAQRGSLRHDMAPHCTLQGTEVLGRNSSRRSKKTQRN